MNTDKLINELSELTNEEIEEYFEWFESLEEDTIKDEDIFDEMLFQLHTRNQYQINCFLADEDPDLDIPW